MSVSDKNVFNPAFLSRMFSAPNRVPSPNPTTEPLAIGDDGMVTIPGAKTRILPEWAEAMGYKVERAPDVSE